MLRSELSPAKPGLPLFDREKSTAAGGDPDIAYYHSYWHLSPEEALLIEFTPPVCEHWNFSLNNHRMESLDYRYHTIHVNKHTAVYRPDGSVRIVAAHENLDVPNQLSTTGLTMGTMCLRWIRAEAHPVPLVWVVMLDGLLRAARNHEKCDDFGDPGFLTPFAVPPYCRGEFRGPSLDRIYRA